MRMAVRKCETSLRGLSDILKSRAPDIAKGFLDSVHLDELRVKLENDNYMNVSFIVVNHQEEDSRAKYNELKIRVSEYIPVYQQEEGQADIWSLLKGIKNDVFVYDRCGRLVKHLTLPFSFLQFNYVEDAIKQVYCGTTCGECKHETPNDVCKKEEETPMQSKTDEGPHKHSGSHQQGKEIAAKDSIRPNVHGHKKHHHHHHHHHHKAEGCQTPLDRAAERNEPERRSEGLPESAVLQRTGKQ
ncbi:unnamed protein product [Ranitomeya imitator]|uniref:Selenoprotein P N-terminal domain-containing protein n=1 Tax=Ranitomeya imitator TaxID=111125 RepID=A0ABN9MP49_9NEOB|nr:unnamed protein product [Ranitomeya imitator]